MFDIGLDHISSIIISKSENGFKDLITRLKRTNRPQSYFKNSVIRSPSRLQQRDQSIDKKKLQDRKQKLLKQLQSLDYEIKKTNIEQIKIEQRKKTQYEYNDPVLLNRAADLIARMNQKRKQQSLAHKKQEEKMNIRIQLSLKKFKQLQQMQQKQKQQKRHKIEQRIMKRKQNIKVLNQYSKKSNYLIHQLQNYRLSLPIISSYKNPEEKEQKNDNSVIITETIKKKPSLLPKQYPKSSFWEHIQKQQINKKRQQYMKSYQKKKIRERQQVYGKKVRKNLKQSSVFVTD